MLVAARCGLGELEGPHLGPLFIGARGDCLWPFVLMLWPQYVLGHSGMLAATVQFQYFSDCTVLASTRWGYNPGNRSSGCGQGVPDFPISLLL